MSRLQYYTIQDRATGEILFREETARYISQALGVMPKLVSFWATVRCAKYIVTTKEDRRRGRKNRPVTIRRTPMMELLEEKVRRADELGISYGKLMQREMINEIRRKK